MDAYIKLLQQASGDIWKIYKKHLLHEQRFSDAWWENMLKEFKETCKKYEGTEVAEYTRLYANACAYDAERLSKQIRGEH